MSYTEAHRYCLGDLLLAFYQVPQELYSWDAAKTAFEMDIAGHKLNMVQQTYKQQIERVFAYELYHQLRKIMEFKPDRYKNMHLHGEIFKENLRTLPNFELKNFGFSSFDENVKGFVPDLTLHGANDNIEDDSQALVIEIKTDVKPNATKDIVKLLNLVSNYDFSYGVFISINCNTEVLIKHIKNEYMGDISKESIDNLNLFERLKIMSRTTTYSNITEMTLKNILNNE